METQTIVPLKYLSIEGEEGPLGIRECVPGCGTQDDKAPGDVMRRILCVSHRLT